MVLNISSGAPQTGHFLGILLSVTKPHTWQTWYSLTVILDHIHDGPFIQLGMEALRIPGVTEGQRGNRFTLFFGDFQKLRILILADGFFPLEGFFQIGVRVLDDQVFDQVHLPGGMHPLRLGDGAEQQGDLRHLFLVRLFRIGQQPKVRLCLTDERFVDVVLGLGLHQYLHGLIKGSRIQGVEGSRISRTLIY